MALQERLAEAERRKPCTDIKQHKPLPEVQKIVDGRPKSAHQTAKLAIINKTKKCTGILEPVSITPPKTVKPNESVMTTIITEAHTITLPIITNSSTSCLPKYETMPSPTRTNVTPLNEIFEEGDCIESTPRATSRQFVSRNQNRTSYEQRRSKFHKTRTASCSSSDASDDDSENRKKRAHKLNTSGKPLPGRRDSYDDSSDSQEPGTGAGTGGSSARLGTILSSQTSKTTQEAPKSNGTGNTSTGGRKNCPGNQTMLGRRHKASRRRNGETRLRESQSLNRITEVQEDNTTHAVVISTNISASQGNSVVPKVKGLGARILQGFTGSKKTEEKNKTDEKVQHMSRKDSSLKTDIDLISKSDKEENKTVTMKKMRILGKYFHMHKKLYIPIPGLFNRNRLYKAQSCSSLTRDKIITDSVLRKQRAVSVIRNNIGSDGDINQNMGSNDQKNRKPTVQLNTMCNGIDMCTIHLGQASKRSFC